jgi:hypothetical protein
MSVQCIDTTGGWMQQVRTNYTSVVSGDKQDCIKEHSLQNIRMNLANNRSRMLQCKYLGIIGNNLG